MSDQQIWSALQSATGTDIIAFVAAKHGLPVDRVRHVWLERQFMAGGG